ETLLRWIPALNEWLTVKYDGSVIQAHDLVAVGGIICNSLGRQLGVFDANLGCCTITMVELQATTIGLELAWEMKAKKIHMQVDSQVISHAITGNRSDDLRHNHLKHQIHQLLERD
ncbi:Putative ribonuclease H protein At1g65750, partial [Linum perenne]